VLALMKSRLCIGLPLRVCREATFVGHRTLIVPSWRDFAFPLRWAVWTVLSR
jgi:hypothetical protein